MTRAVPAFDELQVRLTPGPDAGYHVAISSAAGARANGTFRLPFSGLELENFRLTVDPRGGRVRGRSSPQVQRARQFGDALFGALLADGPVRDVYTAAAHDAETAGRGLRLTLYVTAAPDLAGIPWEFLYRRPAFLAQSIWTPVVRYLDLESPPPALPVQPPLKLLGMVSQPTGDGWPALDVGQEQARLEQALAPLVDDGYVQLRWLTGATLRDLQREVAHGDDFHVFHYIGHGEFDERTGEGSLVLEGADGSPRYVDGETLGTVLCDRRSVRLAVLNACEGAKASPVDPLAGVAAGLVQHDVPAVVGMQFAISDQAAITFASELYSGLAHAFPIDVAVTEGRRALATEGDLEWATPVLFMRVPDGALFDIDLSARTPAALSSEDPDDAGSDTDDPEGPPTPERRRRVLLGGVAALCAIAIAAAVLLQGHPPPKPEFRAALAAALKPLVTANRELTSAVVSLDGNASPGRALERYYSVADRTTAFGGAVGRLRPSSPADRRLHGEAGRLGDYQATYLRYVIAFLTGTQTRRNEEQFGNVSARLVRSLRRLASVAPGAHDSVKGAARLKRWARGVSPVGRDAPSPPATGGGAPADTRSTAKPGDRPAAPSAEARFTGNASRTAPPGTAVPIGVTAKDAQGRDLTVRCDRETVTVTGDAVKVTCTAFLPGGGTRSTSFSIAPQRRSDPATGTPRQPDVGETSPEAAARPGGRRTDPRPAARREAAARAASSSVPTDRSAAGSRAG
jgi:hypothetical protein